jgi:hypothetical protein
VVSCAPFAEVMHMVQQQVIQFTGSLIEIIVSSLLYCETQWKTQKASESSKFFAEHEGKQETPKKNFYNY